MNLLLLLSALLSALSGLGGSARAPVAVQAVAEAAASRPATTAAARIVARRPVASLPALLTSAAKPLAPMQAPAEAIPAWKARRRE